MKSITAYSLIDASVPYLLQGWKSCENLKNRIAISDANPELDEDSYEYGNTNLSRRLYHGFRLRITWVFSQPGKAGLRSVRVFVAISRARWLTGRYFVRGR